MDGDSGAYTGDEQLKRHLGSYLDYLSHQKAASPNTVDSYRRDLQGWVRFVQVEQIDWQLADQKNLYGFIIDLQEKRGVGRRTQARKVSSVKSFYLYLEKQGIIEQNLLKKVRAPKYTRGLPRPIRPLELERVLEVRTEQKSWIQKRDSAFMELLYSSGLRVSEALSVRYGDLCDQNGGFRGEFRVIGKGNKERVCFIGKHAIDALNSYREATTKPWKPEDQFFLNYNGKPLTRQGAVYILKQRGRHGGLEMSITPHMFRHTFATDLLNEGADIRVVQEMLGHASVSTTQNYTRVALDRLRNTFWTAHPHAKKRGSNDET